jgi:glycosyltransferase involved in cell wall biosynthesis
MRVAFVHEYLNQFGGAERMLASMAELFPRAPIYTLLYDERATRGLFKNRVIHTSFLQRFPGALGHHERYPLLMPLAVEQFDLSAFDLVISLSASFAKGVITKPHTRHICYCLTPPRFLWDNSQQFTRDFGFSPIIRGLLPPFISYLRLWDRHASHRVDEFWRISDFVGQRIEKYYRQPSKLIYPPVDVGKFEIRNPKSEIGDYFLMVGRLVSYKKFDVAVQAFNKLNLPLKIVGVGPELKRLKKMAQANIEFLGQINDDELAYHYRTAQALIFPQEEDFGIVPLEAMASGRPVIAYNGGGAMETVLAGETGLLFDEQTPESLAMAVREFGSKEFKPLACRAQAEKFSTEIFKANVMSALSSTK